MARHQIRRLPVVEDAVIVGMISLGDLAVKSEEDEASAALEDISEGVREAGLTTPVAKWRPTIFGSQRSQSCRRFRNSGKHLTHRWRGIHFRRL